MPARWLFITGTDTNVGKSVLATLLVRRLMALGRNVIAFKPIAAGTRTDVRTLAAALEQRVPLNVINPWSFARPLAPLLAARTEHRHLRLPQVVRHLQRHGRAYEVAVVEGAGGLLSPLGEGFDSRDLVSALRALPVVVAPNRLGAINQVRLVLAALPPARNHRALVVLMNPPQLDRAVRTNVRLLSEFVPAAQLFVVPHLHRPRRAATASQPEVQRTLDRVLRAANLLG